MWWGSLPTPGHWHSSLLHSLKWRSLLLCGLFTITVIISKLTVCGKGIVFVGVASPCVGKAWRWFQLYMLDVHMSIIPTKTEKGSCANICCLVIVVISFPYIVYLCKTCWIKNLNIHFCSCVWNCENELKCTKRTHAHTHWKKKKIYSAFWQAFEWAPQQCHYCAWQILNKSHSSMLLQWNGPQLQMSSSLLYLCGTLTLTAWSVHCGWGLPKRNICDAYEYGYVCHCHCGQDLLNFFGN